MKGPGIKDYIRVIEEKRIQANKEGLTYIELTSKEVHEEISNGFATMPTCCQAIYKLLYIGDEILEKPKGNTGFGSHLKVRFYVDNLEGRERMFPDKKRGRPTKSEEEKLLSRKRRKKCISSDLNKLVEEWLQVQGYEFEDNKEYIEAKNGIQKRFIHVQSVKRGRKQSLPTKFNEVLKYMVDDNVHYSLAFNDSIAYRRAWKEIPQTVKDKLNVSIILADKKGNVFEM